MDRPAERNIEVYTQSMENSVDFEGRARGSAVFRDRHGNTYHVDHPGLAANLERFIGQPDTPSMRLAVERVVQQHVWKEWTITGGTGGTATPALYGPTTSDVWLTWSNTVTASSTINLTVTDADSTWTNWQTTAGPATYNFWVDWSNNPNHSPNFQRTYQNQWSQREETAEERDARVQRELRQREEWDRQRQERERRRIARDADLEAARIQATELLDSILNEIQRESLKDEDWFLVVGKSGNIYRIRRGRVGNIDLVSPEGKVLRSYCVHPSQHLPNADDLVAQKLHLETDDDHLIKMANVSADYGTHGKVIELAKHLPKAA